MATEHVVVEDIDALMQTDLAVRDANGERIGSVYDYSSAAAYLVVRTGPPAHNELYVPYSAITSIDPREIYLNADKDTLLRQLSAPPLATIVVERDAAATIVASGYDGSPAEFNRVDLEMVRRDLTAGMVVYATGNDRIGIVEDFDLDTGYMVVKPHPFSKRDLIIPIAAIVSIDTECDEVFLAVSKDAIQKAYAHMPDAAVPHGDAVASGGDLLSRGAHETIDR